MNKIQWLYARDYPTRQELYEMITLFESDGYHVIVDDNWDIIYETKR